MTLNGLRVVLNRYLTETVFRYPKHRFVEYEEKDQWWLNLLGMGRYEQVPSQEIWRIGDMLLMHPAMWCKLQTEITEVKPPAFVMNSTF